MVFQGMEDFAKVISRNAIFKLLNVAYIFIFIKDPGDLNLYVFGMGIFSIISNISLWVYLPKCIHRVPFMELKPFTNIKTVFSLFIPTIAIQIYTVLDKTMIGIITDSSYENGYYEQALKISKLLVTIVTSLITVMIPRMGRLFEDKETNEIKRYMYQSYRFVWLLGVPMCFGVIMTSDVFVPWFFGTGYDKVCQLLKILPLLILAIGINGVTGGQLLIPSKRENLFTVTVIAGACVNIILNSVFIHCYKSIGAAIASVVAETTIAIIQLIFVRKEISAKIVIYQGIPYFIAGMVMIGCLLPLRIILRPSPISFFIMVFIGSASYFAVLLAERDEFLIRKSKALLITIKEKMNPMKRRKIP